jgi:hypothetical protein
MSLKQTSGLLLGSLLIVAMPLAASAEGPSEAEQGQGFYNQLVSGQTSCSKLQDDQFELMGDFYMERMMGADAHAQMDKTMSDQMGEGANAQMHIAMAKRLSGCDLNAAYPAAAVKYQWLSGITGMGMMNGGMMGNTTNTASAGPVSSTWAWVLIGLFAATILVHLGLIRFYAPARGRKRN